MCHVIYTQNVQSGGGSRGSCFTRARFLKKRMMIAAHRSHWRLWD